MLNIPSGVIVIWSGALVNIPAGWTLCDGNNGTPDLRTRFVIGAGGILDPDATGGTTTHNHTFTTDGHWHELPAGHDLDTGNYFDDATDVKTDTGTTQVANHLPPFYALAFIMKI